MTTKKGDARKGAKPGQRLAFDDTKHDKKGPSKSTLARKTTTKGAARKTAPIGSRLAYDDTKQEKKKAGGGLAKWRAAVKKANAKLGTSGIPRKGSKAYTEAKKIYGK
tara:strand:+ start:377 stop:700 length:324 start_codon:yes stop_codon:yes gene_type:complete